MAPWRRAARRDRLITTRCNRCRKRIRLDAIRCHHCLTDLKQAEIDDNRIGVYVWRAIQVAVGLFLLYQLMTCGERP